VAGLAVLKLALFQHFGSGPITTMYYQSLLGGLNPFPHFKSRIDTD